jgi:hypothetical protein
VLEHPLDVAGLDEHVGVHPLGGARVAEELLEGQRGLRAAAGVLEQDRVAEHQVGPDEPDDLVGGVVPGLHAQQHAERVAAQDGVAGVGRQRPRRREARTLVAVVAQDARGEVDLLLRLTDQLPHLERRQVGEQLAALGEQLAGATDDGGPLLERPLPPAQERVVGRLDRPVDRPRCRACRTPGAPPRCTGWWSHSGVPPPCS